jgi:hypothetical protein
VVFHTKGAQLGAVQFGLVVRTYRAYITSAQAPLRCGDNCGGYLASEANFSRYRVGLSVARREFRQPQNYVRRILSNACEIGEGHLHDAKAYLKWARNQKGKLALWRVL